MGEIQFQSFWQYIITKNMASFSVRLFNKPVRLFILAPNSCLYVFFWHVRLLISVDFYMPNFGLYVYLSLIPPVCIFPTVCLLKTQEWLCLKVLNIATVVYSFFSSRHFFENYDDNFTCLLYTSPSPRDRG